MQSYGSCTLRFYSMRYINIQSFLLVPLAVSELISGQSSKCKNIQRAITLQYDNVEVRFLSNALLLNEMYIPTKFLVDISCSFRVMSRTRCGRTDGHMGGQKKRWLQICFSFEKHKKFNKSCALIITTHAGFVCLSDVAVKHAYNTRMSTLLILKYK